MAAHFLQQLPSRNKSNFAKMDERCFKKPDSEAECRPYICLEDNAQPQVIVTEKTNILLEFLHKQWDYKMQLNKRPKVSSSKQEAHSSSADEDDNTGGSSSASHTGRSQKQQPSTPSSPTKKRRVT